MSKRDKKYIEDLEGENKRLRKLIQHMGECIGGRWVTTEMHIEGDKLMLHICVSDDTEDESIAKRIADFLEAWQDGIAKVPR